MTRKEVLNSVELKQRFCKDCNLPISVYDNPYFYQRVCALHPYFGCMDKFDDFCDELKRFENAQQYFGYYNQIKEAMINDIKTSDGYADFNERIFAIQANHPSRHVYVEENDGALILYVDMKKANFSALSHFNSGIFGGAKTWEDFVQHYTDLEHIKKSKYIRQVILGACNPKRQIQYETYLMNTLLNHVLAEFPQLSVFSIASDEIIFRVDGVKFSMKKFRDVVAECPGGIGNLVRVGTYQLSKIKGTGGWLKEHNDEKGTVEFKCLPSDIYHQVVKYYTGDPITDSDLVILHDGRLAKYMEAIKNPWKR